MRRTVETSRAEKPHCAAIVAFVTAILRPVAPVQYLATAAAIDTNVGAATLNCAHIAAPSPLCVQAVTSRVQRRRETIGTVAETLPRC